MITGINTCSHFKNSKHWQPYDCLDVQKHIRHYVNPQRWHVAAEVEVTCSSFPPKHYHLHRKEEEKKKKNAKEEKWGNSCEFLADEVIFTDHYLCRMASLPGIDCSCLV